MTSKSFERKLSAILSADVAGYSRLMGSDEELTITTLTGHREMMSTLIENHNGRVIDSPGDNLLAAFASVTQAVDCAVEIQREMAERNEELPDDRKMEYRIGVNLGDVIEEGDRIYGDGVNIAARLEALAEPGGICISGFVYNQVKNRLKLEYEYLGEQSVKNIKEPVPIYRVLSFPGAAAHRVIEAKKEAEMVSRSSSVKDNPSIAVLPFVNISSDPEQEYFVDGLSEELLNSLTKIPDLLVTARTSSFSFKGTNKKVQEIAKDLGVAHILEGSVRKAGNALRITAQLIRATDGFHLWSEKYDRELKDIFAVQEDIATTVANELKVTLGIGKSLKKLGSTDNEKAYELYLVALGQMNNWGMESLALESINEALALDPEFALAWATKALIHHNITVFVPPNQISFELDAGLNAALKAIELEPTLATGYFSLGSIRSVRGEWIEAESAYRKGMELTDETLLRNWGAINNLYTSVGYFKRAHEFLEAERRYDPLHQANRGFYFLSFVYLGDTQRAIEEHDLGRSLFGNQWHWGNHFITMIRLGENDSLTRDKIPEIPDPIWSIARDRLVSPEDGLHELRRLYSDQNNLSVQNLETISRWAAYFGDPEFAMEAMEKAVSMVAVETQWLWLPLYREVRQLPRFKEFVIEIGLVDYWNKFGWPDFCHQLDNGDLEFD